MGKHGRLKGFSPSEYIQRIGNYSLPPKALNYIHANYNHALCANVIWRLGYGSLGPKKLTGTAVTTRPFLVYSTVSDHVLSMNLTDLIQHLNFEWFETSYICKDHPRECD